MLSHEETLKLIELAKTGDNDAKTRLISENTPLIKSRILIRKTLTSMEWLSALCVRFSS